MPRRLFNLMAVASLFGMLAGCSTLSVFNWGKEFYPHAGQGNPVVKVVALWQGGEGTTNDGKPTRGFAGQIYFFTGKDKAPAVVDGDIRIYVYDDQGAPEQQVKPIHQFDYSAESWAASMKTGKLGPVYVAFIPYTRKGMHEAVCTLRVRFTSRQGTVVHSEMVNVTLPGTKTKSADQKAAASPQLTSTQPANAAAATAERKEPRTRPAAASRGAESIQDLLAAAKLNARDAGKKPNAVKLTDSERERIIRETRAKMSGDVKPQPAATRASATEEVRVAIPATNQRNRDAASEQGTRNAGRSTDDEEPSGDSASLEGPQNSLKTLSLRLPAKI